MNDNLATIITNTTRCQDSLERLELSITKLDVRIGHIERLMDEITGKKTRRNIIKTLEEKTLKWEPKIMPEKGSYDYQLLEKLTKERKEKEKEKEEKEKLEKLAKYEEMKNEINKDKEKLQEESASYE